MIYTPSLARTSVLITLACSVSGCGEPSPNSPAPGPSGPRIELADEAALALIADPRQIDVFGDGKYIQTGSYDRETGEPPPAAFVANGNRDMNHFVCKSADASVSSAQVVPPIFDEPSCAESYVKGVVLARFEGSGRMARMWMTASSLRNGLVANDEVFRIWVDDESSPVVEDKLAAIIDGTAGEMFAPPFGDGPGDHLAWYYPVVFSKKLIVALDNLGPLEYYYHQVGAVLDPKPAARKAAPTRLPGRDAAIKTLTSTDKGAVEGETLLAPALITLAPSQTQTLAELTGPATIYNLSVEVAENARASLADVEFVVTWDNEVEPAMRLPLSSLFAASLDAPENKSLGLAGSTTNGKVRMELRLPMPFKTSAKFVATSALAAPVDVTLEIRGEKVVPSSAFGKLHTVYHETKAPASGKTRPIASVTGRGRWAGTCFELEGRGINDGTAFDEPFNFLEGDELGTLDGELRIRGTGTEDYLNGAFYFESGPHASPFAQWWGAVVTAPTARASACRFHLLGDTIDFASSADLQLEIGPGIPETLVRYRSVAFLYQ